jgi:hypothetical protein
MISEVYDAFRSAGDPEDKARAAAEALSEDQLATKTDIVKLEKELPVIKWMLGLVIRRRRDFADQALLFVRLSAPRPSTAPKETSK